LKYISGLAKGLARRGGRIFTKSHADQIDGGSPGKVTVGKHTVTANAVVVATNTPVNDRYKIHTKQAPYMTYVIGARVPSGSAPKALFWDTGPVSQQGHPVPYHYVRQQTI